MSVKIFFCYAHEDEALLNRLKHYLRPLQRQGLIDVWHDRDISAGTEWEHEIDKYLNTAQIILLLVSQYFMNSDYAYTLEAKRALERHELGEARVIPVILRPVYWQKAPFAKLEPLPTNAQPITGPNWHNLDEAFYKVVDGVRRVVNEFSREQWLVKSDTYYRNNRYEEALIAAEQAIKFDPNYARTFNQKGNALYRLDHYEEALHAYMQAIERDPNYGEAYSGMGHALLMLKRFDKALEAYNRAIGIDSSLVTAYIGKGDAFREHGNYQDAILAYYEALQKDPHAAEAFYGRGLVRRALLLPEKALQDFEQAIKLRPDYASFHYEKGRILRKLGRLIEALAAYDEAVHLAPNSALFHTRRGDVLRDLKRYGEAIAAYERALQISHDFEDAIKGRHLLEKP